MKSLLASSGFGGAAHVYCGAPPTPGSLLARWNLDPFLLIALIAVLITFVFTARGLSRWRRGTFVAGWAVAAAALISPLCALSVSLFSARVGQHMVLEMIAAPLVALALTGGNGARWSGGRRPALASAAFAAALWFWHAPAPYGWTFDNSAIYWLMHLTSFAAALWLWIELIGCASDRIVAPLAASAATSLQMGLLGALITFTSRPAYAPHALTTWAWGFTPLADQQLGGVIMWVPAGAILLAAFVIAVAGAMRLPPLYRLVSAT